MERLRSRLNPQVRMDARVLTGNPARVICDLAHSERFNVIILSSHGDAGLARMFIGSVAERVVQDAVCPVLVVKPHRDEAGQFIMEPVHLKLEHLLVGYDHRNGSRRALTIARAIAKRAGASITLVHALPPPPSLGPLQSIVPGSRAAEVDQAIEWLRQVAASHENSAKEWDVRVGTGHPWDVIIDFAKSSSSDLIVIGPHEHTRWGHCFVGSTAQRVVRLAPCSVLAVK
jgi:nucleotide-binding universal stress UspA family protein